MKNLSQIVGLLVVAYVVIGFVLMRKDGDHLKSVNAIQQAGGVMNADGTPAGGKRPYQNLWGDLLDKFYPWLPG